MPNEPKKPVSSDPQVARGDSHAAATRSGATIHEPGVQSAEEHAAIGTAGRAVLRAGHKLPVSKNRGGR